MIRDHAHAVELANQVIKTLDTSPLEPIVAAMLTIGHRAALSAMAISRDEPDLLTQFLAVCQEAGFLSEAECDALDDEYVEAKRRRAA
ncbi:hypothetical protein TRICHSKD4_6158 [Roseibium sp. TrichSKD4]|uniref:hypothetical protein n=1 Tax=Roseibium sp. TrichSKD4 TaxID=744980 RepID=UPI0001E5721C|nr:hypothetical protein [Roseibium sp. TrichSKD4]EFO28778.1 hypothetical protein TRICHSKD4_6158 [Roseibium sp. TrichSKD4]